MTASDPVPTEVTLHQQSRVLEVAFADGERFELPCEYLRVYSPSAEVQGHSPQQAVLQVGKENVNVAAIRPVGNYGIQLDFDDGHNTGIYSWDYLYELGANHGAYWQDYLNRLKAAGFSRQKTDDGGRTTED